MSEIRSQSDFATDLIDPAKMRLPAGLAPEGNAAIVELRKRLADADAFVVVTPEYNHGYPAALKSVIDAASQPWQAKPVAFVSYGGISGGLRAVEQLRLVFAELHAVTIRDCVSFANAWNSFDSDGLLIDGAAASNAVATMLKRLGWWARILREARQMNPYGQVAA